MNKRNEMLKENNFSGLIRDSYDPNDLIYERQFKIKSPDVILPDSFNLLYKTPPFRSQGKKGACVAMASCSALSMLPEYEGLTFSVDFLYHFSRILENSSYKDNGVSLKSSLKAMHRFGVCLEEMFPYNEDIVDREPSTECIMNGLEHRIDKYYKIKNGLYSIKSYLYTERLPILFGMTVFESAKSEKVRRTGIIPIPKSDEEVVGNHGLLCVGYKSVSRFEKLQSVFNSTLSSDCYLVCLNSWDGYNENDGNILYIPVEMFTQHNFCFDFWAISGAYKEEKEKVND